MKVKYYSVVLIFGLIFASCVTKTQHQSQETSSTDSIPHTSEYKKPNREQIISLIKEDEEKRSIWSYDFKESTSSPLFYEAICDDGLYLYRVVSKGGKVSVVMLEDSNIGELVDFFVGRTDTTGVEYKHEGSYEIIDDSTVDVFFDKWYRNWVYINETETLEPIYHIKCTHRYKLSGVEWHRINADTTVVIDEREKALCEDIWRYTD